MDACSRLQPILTGHNHLHSGFEPISDDRLTTIKLVERERLLGWVEANGSNRLAVILRRSGDNGNITKDYQRERAHTQSRKGRH